MSRGQLRIYLGAAPGVGKTYAMLDEGARRRARGADVVVGVVETHGRAATGERLDDLEVLPRRSVEHRGSVVTEMDLDALLRRRPDVALVDELAHTNAPGSRNEKRFADIEELLEAGIDVVSTVNIQHLDSVNDVVERITGVRQRETVPDQWVRRADQVELVDMTPEALRRRMAHGNVYPAERIDTALSNYFRPGNLAALRELALLWVADRVEDQLQSYLEAHGIDEVWETRERVIVALTGAPGNDLIVRRAARIAGRIGGELLGVHIARGDGRSGGADEQLHAHRDLLEELGGTYREAVGEDVADTLVSVARAERATQIVIGASRRSRLQELTGGSVVNDLLRLARDLDVHVISTDAVESRRLPAVRRRHSALPRRRVLTSWVVLAVGLLLLGVVLDVFAPDLSLATNLLLALLLVVVVGAIGGLVPGVVGAVVAGLMANYLFVEPTGSFTVGQPQNALSLAVFVIVGATVSTLVDRVARRSADAARSRSAAGALARAAAVLAAVPDPLQELVVQLRDTFAMESVSVLEREADGTWVTRASAGDDPPSGPDDGEVHERSDDGRVAVVGRSGPSTATDPVVLEAFLDSLSVALETRRLQADAASAAALAEADALRTGILQAVSHDLRTPLSGIKASVTSLLAPDVAFDEDDTEEFLRTIDAEVDRLDRVVGNLLDMGRIQTGTVTALRRPTALEEVVHAAVANLGLRGDEIDVRVDETAPLADIDGALVERALANVLANALAVQPAGTPVRIEAGAAGAEGRRRVHLRVVDTGPGLPEESRERVFEPFQRLGDRSTQAGVGLGLAIAHGFTRAVGGRLVLDDTPGGGLTVTFDLPASETAAVTEPELT